MKNALYLIRVLNRYPISARRSSGNCVLEVLKSGRQEAEGGEERATAHQSVGGRMPVAIPVDAGGTDAEKKTFVPRFFSSG